jgi:crossover junction endodeoxyribonuclease RuvC
MRASRSSAWRRYEPAHAHVRVPVAAPSLRILGLDPGSRVTGYGVVVITAGRAAYVASGCIRPGAAALPLRLAEIHRQVAALVVEYAPDELAIERVFVHANPDSALKLGHARGAALAAVAAAGVEVHEYAPRAVKQTVTSHGGADKEQVQHMVKALLGVQGRMAADAADALAIALCHAQHRGLAALLARGGRR